MVEVETADALWQTNGLNKKCAKCVNECKQNGSAEIVYCPLFSKNAAGSISLQYQPEVIVTSKRGYSWKITKVSSGKYVIVQKLREWVQKNGLKYPTVYNSHKTGKAVAGYTFEKVA
jgi:hypothetical protein